jgi:hypothetical protein
MGASRGSLIASLTDEILAGTSVPMTLQQATALAAGLVATGWKRKKRKKRKAVRR